MSNSWRLEANAIWSRKITSLNKMYISRKMQTYLIFIVNSQQNYCIASSESLDEASNIADNFFEGDVRPEMLEFYKQERLIPMASASKSDVFLHPYIMTSKEATGLLKPEEKIWFSINYNLFFPRKRFGAVVSLMKEETKSRRPTPLFLEDYDSVDAALIVLSKMREVLLKKEYAEEGIKQIGRIFPAVGGRETNSDEHKSFVFDIPVSVGRFVRPLLNAKLEGIF